MSVNIAVLLDLNALPSGSDKETQHKYLKWVQEHILNLITSKASDEKGDVDYSSILWSYKYFNSSKDVDYRNKKLEPFSISTFEGFESSSLAEYDRFCSSSDTEDCADDNKCSCFSQALKRITSDLAWEENECKMAKPKNIIFAVLRVPRDEDELSRFMDNNDDYLSSPNSRQFLNSLLPSAFLKSFHSKFHIQLNFIDTWVLHKEENVESGWNGSDYSKQCAKVLEYLNKGTIIPLQNSQPAPAGLPSYYNLLKNSLRAASAAKGTPTSEKLSEAQKVLQHNKQVLDSAKSNKKKHLARERELLDLSLDSQLSNRSKARRDKSHGMHKENHGRFSYGSTEKSRKYYEALHDLSFGRESALGTESSASEDFGSQVFCRKEEKALKRLIMSSNAKKALRHPQKMAVQGHHSHSSRSKCMQPPAQKRLRRYSPPRSSVDGDSINSGPNPFSRAAQLLGIATHKERKKWQAALRKEEDEKRLIIKDRRKILAEIGTYQKLMDVRLKMYMQKCNLSDCTDLELILPAIKDFKDQCVKDESLNILSVCQAIVPFMIGTLQANNIVAMQSKEYLEKSSLHVSIQDLRATVLKSKNDEAELAQIFRECQLQILFRMEVAWLLQNDTDNTETLRDEIVDLLSLLAVYIKKPVDDFLANVIVQAYMETHSELLLRLYRGLSMDPPRNLVMQVTPSKSVRSRCSFQGSSIKSPFGSTDSLFVPPGSKQLAKTKEKTLQREDSFVSTKSSARYASHVYVNNPKKMVMIPARNVKKFTTVPKSPKPAATRSSRVRRNLFDADASKSKSSLSLTRLSRSPSVVASNRSYGDSLASPRLRGMKSKRKLNLGDDDEEDDGYRNFSNLASPDMFSRSNDRDSNILCPATPSDKSYNSARKRKRTSSCKSSGERVIQESPECPKQGFAQSSSFTVPAISFYSTGSDSFRSRAWEQSGNKMMAAKIKRKIDSCSFMNSGLTLSDLEIIGGSASSPESKSGLEQFQSPLRKNPPIRPAKDEEPCCSKSINKNVEVVHANVNANIEALIRSGQSLALLKTTPKSSATPTKKISFNFDERLIKTPNRSSPGTPKGILKTPNRHDDSARKSSGSLGLGNLATPLKATHFQVETKEKSPEVNFPTPSSVVAVDEQLSVESPSVSQNSFVVEAQPPPTCPQAVDEQPKDYNDSPLPLVQSDVNLGIVNLPSEMGYNSMGEVCELQPATPSSLQPSMLQLLYGSYYQEYGNSNDLMFPQPIYNNGGYPPYPEPQQMYSTTPTSCTSDLGEILDEMLGSQGAQQEPPHFPAFSPERPLPSAPELSNNVD